jgi:hypothetical protein
VPWLKTTVVQMAWPACRKQNRYWDLGVEVEVKAA